MLSELGFQHAMVTQRTNEEINLLVEDQLVDNTHRCCERWVSTCDVEMERGPMRQQTVQWKSTEWAALADVVRVGLSTCDVCMTSGAMNRPVKLQWGVSTCR